MKFFLMIVGMCLIALIGSIFVFLLMSANRIPQGLGTLVITMVMVILLGGIAFEEAGKG